MFGKLLSASAMAAVLGAFPALADLAGPAELPPPSFKGQQYVDSRGCVFLRAGYGGQVNWVPRVSRDHKQLCNGGPSGGKAEVVVEEGAASSVVVPKAVIKEAVVAPTPTPKVVAVSPKVTAAAKSAPARVVARVVERPATATELAATTGASAGIKGARIGSAGGGAGYRLACPAETPVAERFAVTTGGTKVLCTRGDGSLAGANFPVLVAGSTDGYPMGYDAYVAAGNVKIVAGGSSGVAGATAYVPAQGGKTAKRSLSAKLPDPTPPPGYKLAWKDGRLNPNRGKQTVEGFLAQDEIWTRTVPAELREDSKVKRKPVTIIVRNKDGSQSKHAGYVLSTKSGKTVEFADSASAKVSKSTMAVAPEMAKPAKAEPAAGGSYLVQVGTFGVVSNAEGVAGRLKGLGLPVARAKIKGGALTVVYAGPFASAADAKAALSAARGAGFADARVVQ